MRLFILLFCFPFHLLWAQNANDAKQSVMISVEIQENPPQITLNWVEDLQNSGYTIYRKSKGGNNWGAAVGTVLSTATTWTDVNVNMGQAYEYRILKNLAGYGGGNSAGYAYAGFKVPPVHKRGICILVIDSTFQTSLAMEINRLQKDMEEEGWRVKRLYVDRNEAVTTVKDKIKLALVGDNSFFSSVFLIGRVPVPYSGNIAPDGHVPDHQGAWPCDGFYGDLDGVWTDNIVNFDQGSAPRTRNIPGDGKFDQSAFPSALELGIGRVDFNEMPAFTQSHEDLLRAYLNKNHAWRKGMVHAEERGLVQNNFGGFAEGFGQNGWKNFIPMFGPDNVAELPYRSTLQTDSYLWSYGCGAGSYTSAGGITNTTNFTVDSLKTIFTLLFGSYFGDWDSGNNLLRASLATGATLTNAWAARPNWMFHHMALGEPIGFSTRLSMSNNGTLYQSGFAAAGVHTALMGDPTLVMHTFSPPTSLTATQDEFHVDLAWAASPDADGYFVYRRKEGDIDYTLLNGVATTNLTFSDSCVGDGPLTYHVRGVQLRESASGSYYNLGPAASVEIDIDLTGIAAVSQFEASVYFDQVTIMNTSLNASSYSWDFGDGFSSTDSDPTYCYPVADTYSLCLTTSDFCREDLLCKEVIIVSSLPDIQTSIKDASCHGDTDGAIVLSLTGGTPTQNILWSNNQSGPVLENLSAGNYSFTLTTETGKSQTFGPFTIEQPDSIGLEAAITHATTGQANGSIVPFSMSSCQQFTYLWSNGASIPSISGLLPGVYCLTVTAHDCNQCTEVACFTVEETTSLFDPASVFQLDIYPNPTDGIVVIKWLEQELPGVIKGVLMDPMGRILQEVSLLGTSHQWDLRTYPDGRYWLVLYHPTRHIAKPIDKISTQK